MVSFKEYVIHSSAVESLCTSTAVCVVPQISER